MRDLLHPVATRLQDRPPPWRLCCEGTVVRRRRGRARRHGQIAHAGVECIGLEGAGADVEVVSLAARACEAVDLDNLEWALAHAGRRFAAEPPLRAALGAEHADGGAAVAETLRRQGVAVAHRPDRNARRALAFARPWGYDAAPFVRNSGVRAQRTSDGASRDVNPGPPVEIEAPHRWARGS